MFQYIFSNNGYTYKLKMSEDDYRLAVIFFHNEVQSKLKDAGHWAYSSLKLIDAATNKPIRKCFIKPDGGCYRYANPEYPPVDIPATNSALVRKPRAELPVAPYTGSYYYGY